MGEVGKHLSHRRSVSVKTGSRKNTQSVDANTSSPQEIAGYIAEMSLELVLMANGANLALVAHLLAMAQAEAEYASDYVIRATAKPEKKSHS